MTEALFFIFELGNVFLPSIPPHTTLDDFAMPAATGSNRGLPLFFRFVFVSTVHQLPHGIRGEASDSKTRSCGSTTSPKS